jgi:hypothetical protein
MFDKKQFWIAEAGGSVRKSIGERFVMNEEQVVFQVDLRSVNWYEERDHVVFGEAVLPGAAHMCAVIEHCSMEWKWRDVELRDVEIREAVVFGEEEPLILQYVYETNLAKWEARQMTTEGWKIHALGKFDEAKDDSKPLLLGDGQRSS